MITRLIIYWERHLSVEMLLGIGMLLALIWVCIASVMYWKICRRIQRQKDVTRTVMQEYVEARGYTILPVLGPLEHREHPTRVSDVVPLRLRKRA